jgi:hypothetical protein
VRVLSVDRNLVGPAGASAFAEAIAANERTALVTLSGVQLSECLDVLGLPDEFRDQSNDRILARMQASRLLDRAVKSSQGGAR